MGVITEVSLPVPAELATNVVGVTSADPAQLDRDHLWHPFTQQQGWSRGRAADDRARRGLASSIDVDGRRYLDGISSLWCNVHGHRHPVIDRAVSEQLGRVAHSTMLGLSHPGAAELAARLVAIAPPGLSRVFYSDSGSTAAEIALKMAFQYQAPARRRARPPHLLRPAARGLPRRHDRLRLGRRDRPLPRRLPAAAVRDPRRRAGRRRRPRAGPRRPRRGGGGGDRRAAGPGRGRDPGPPARLPAGGARALRRATACC